MKDLPTWRYGRETAFKDRLAQARRELAAIAGQDVTDTALAGMVGVTGAAMSKWMGGQMPTRENLKALASVFQGAGLRHITTQLLEYGQDAPSGIKKLPGRRRKLGGDSHGQKAG